ncbi:endo alpha-1,4 polygalactosaminidase [Methanolobus psychrotolerans]|uniref:endo alpha-1,4 polygalactosaminidase n=1 Tax=Methanolobus psychrotolerans TaxID=1874706 RepID=UPI0013EE33EC|nr:endo alpha-1,4 polygalactosaminidase [Methanolobus psychrotolerans]
MDLKLLAIIFLITLIVLTSGCSGNGTNIPESPKTNDLSEITESDASGTTEPFTSVSDYRQQMRDFVIGISTYSKQKNPDFMIIPQNGQELLTSGGEADDPIVQDYIAAIGGVGREDLFFGYDDDNVATEEEDSEYMASLLDVARDNGVVVLVTDYCWTKSFVNASYRENANRGYISFAADSRDLDTIPDYPAEPYNVNSNDIQSLDDAENFLYIINPEESGSKEEFLESLQETDYDVILIDLFFYDLPLTSDDISSLKTKSNGGSRRVIAYMSIGEAEDYRYYWDGSWSTGSSEWLEAENPDWGGNYKVRYWNEEWQSVIYGNEDAYLDMILDAGFDGVYLDIIDAFEYFEE